MAEGSSSRVRQRRRLTSELGTQINREMIASAAAIFDPLHPVEPPQRIVRDLAYGDDVRHRLDVHLSVEVPEKLLPVVVFLHSGGFVAGDKGGAGRPLFDNIGRLAVDAGFVGVTMNYRLAPSATFPAGAEDVARAVRFLNARAVDYHGDPEKIILMGHSAGAAHVASFLAIREMQNDTRGVVGAILSSGIYEPSLLPEHLFSAYYGADKERRARCSAMPGLLTCDVPLLIGVAERDPPEIHRQTASLATAVVETTGFLPRMFFGAGHNHFSIIAHLGTEDRMVSDQIVDFIRTTASENDE